MQINIKGFTQKQSLELKEAALFFARILMDPRMVRSLILDIERDKTSSVQGECIDEDGTKNPRWFTINLRGARGDENIIKTLAHEMVHVKQHAKNELQTGCAILAKGKLVIRSKWKGEIWKPKRNEDPYFDSPHEIEAFGKEVGLYQRWLTSLES